MNDARGGIIIMAFAVHLIMMAATPMLCTR